MKKFILLVASLALILSALGCKRNPKSIISLPEEIVYVGDYLEISDVKRIGHALDTADTRATVQWENGSTGFQYSMMVFSTNAGEGTTTRKFTVLSIAPSRDAEVLNLIGTSTKKNVWAIVAEAPASKVGKAARMQLGDTPVPEASISSGQVFSGFEVAD